MATTALKMPVEASTPRTTAAAMATRPAGLLCSVCGDSPARRKAPSQRLPHIIFGIAWESGMDEFINRVIAARKKRKQSKPPRQPPSPINAQQAGADLENFILSDEKASRHVIAAAKFKQRVQELLEDAPLIEQATRVDLPSYILFRAGQLVQNSTPTRRPPMGFHWRLRNAIKQQVWLEISGQLADGTAALTDRGGLPYAELELPALEIFEFSRPTDPVFLGEPFFDPSFYKTIDSMNHLFIEFEAEPDPVFENATNRKNARARRIEAVLWAIDQLGHDPQALPRVDIGMSGVQAAVDRLVLGHADFQGLFTPQTKTKNIWKIMMDNKIISFKS